MLKKKVYSWIMVVKGGNGEFVHILNSRNTNILTIKAQKELEKMSGKEFYSDPISIDCLNKEETELFLDNRRKNKNGRKWFEYTQDGIRKMSFRRKAKKYHVGNFDSKGAKIGA